LSARRRWSPAGSAIPRCPRSASRSCAGWRTCSVWLGITFTPTTPRSAERSSPMFMLPVRDEREGSTSWPVAGAGAAAVEGHGGFCAVKRGRPEAVAVDEPERLAEACHRLGLRHVVITSVTRDDLPDGGAEHFRRCILAVRQRTGATIEVLTPDFDGRSELI